MRLGHRIRKVARKLGFDLVRWDPNALPPDLSDEDKRIIQAVRPFTMTSVERIVALLDAVRHILRYKVPGAIVECGVWRGGSIMATLLALINQETLDRDVYLFDTFQGMSEPTENDKTSDGTLAAKQLLTASRDSLVWACASLDDVRNNVLSTRYPGSKIHFVQGKVEQTIPGMAPPQIALLRLDTDWYESTRHELEHLFGLLDRRGILIVDDYGHWSGARKAVDEFFSSRSETYYFHRIDYTARTITRIGA